MERKKTLTKLTINPFLPAVFQPKQLKWALLLVLFFFIPQNVLQAQITSTTNGNWASTSTWVGGTVPSGVDNVTVDHDVEIQAGTTAEVNNLTIGSAGILTVEGTLIINGTLTMVNNDPELIAGSDATIVIHGNANISNKVNINLSSYFIVLGDLTISGGGGTDIDISHASIYVFGNFDSGSTGLLICDDYDNDTDDLPSESCHVGTDSAYYDNVDDGLIPDEINDLISPCSVPMILFHPSTSDVNYCISETAVALSISASGDGLSYQWYSNTSASNSGGTELTGETDTFYIPPTLNPGALYFYCVVSGDCGADTSNVSGMITVSELPNNTSTGFSGSTICDGEDGVLYFNALNSTFVTPYTIEYTDGSATWQQEITSDAEFGFNVAVNPVSTTTYTITSITNGNNCSRISGFGDATAQIVVKNLPNNTTTGFSGNTICIGETGVLTFNALNSTFILPYTIEYSDGTTTWQQEVTSNDDFEFDVAVNPSESTSYSLVSITNGDGCTRTTGFGDETAQIIVRQAPSAAISGDASICDDGSTTTLTIDFTGTPPWNVTTQRDGGDDLTVINIDVNPYTFNVSAPGVYTISSFSDANCTGTASGSATVTANELNMAVSDATLQPSGNHCPEFLPPFNPNSASYNPGVTEVIFKVTKNLSASTDWTFDFEIDETGAVEVYDLLVEGNNSMISYTGNAATGSIDGGDNTEVTFTFQIWNVPGTELDVNFSVSNGSDGICDETETLLDNNKIHTINAMPAIGGISP